MSVPWASSSCRCSWRSGTSRVQARHRDRAPVLQGPWFGLHVSLLFAYASFALACVSGLFTCCCSEIKAKHLDFPRAAAVAAGARPDEPARVVIGWIFLTVGLIVGIWRVGALARMARSTRGCRRYLSKIPRSSSPFCAGSSIRSSCSRRGASAGEAGVRRTCRRSGS